MLEIDGMDEVRNPFAPGAGIQPPELAGRDQILDDAKVALSRVKLGRPARSKLMLGLRGVGKTVLLNSIDEQAGQEGFLTVMIEAPEDRRLADLLVPPVRKILLKLSRVERVREAARHGLGILRSFASAFKVEMGDLEFGVRAETGTADSGQLESDLPEVLLALAGAAREAGSPIALLIDEVQYLSSGDLAALITAVHKIGQKGLPFVVFGAGLPQLAALAGEAKSYAERLFNFPNIGPLSHDSAREAIRAPVRREGVDITDDALALIIEKTKGYPYFIQEWGHHTWNVAKDSPISVDDVERATAVALTQLDAEFFRVRLDRLTPREKEYMRAMAELGPGPHRSGEIAQALLMNVTTAAPLRNGLIKKGMIFSPQHGDTSFTVPMFDEFMRRSMPVWAAAASEPRRKKPRNK
jgi:AAA ATPase domain